MREKERNREKRNIETVIRHEEISGKQRNCEKSKTNSEIVKTDRVTVTKCQLRQLPSRTNVT